MIRTAPFLAFAPRFFAADKGNNATAGTGTAPEAGDKPTPPDPDPSKPAKESTAKLSPSAKPGTDANNQSTASTIVGTATAADESGLGDRVSVPNQKPFKVRVQRVRVLDKPIYETDGRHDRDDEVVVPEERAKHLEECGAAERLGEVQEVAPAELKALLATGTPPRH